MPKFHVEKTIVVAETPGNVFAAVRDFKQWPVWSPWLIAEPGCDVSYPADGAGYAWSGKCVGAGEMRITAEDKPKSIEYRLTFLKPWKSVSTVRFAFAPTDNGTSVSWSMEGSLPIFLFWMKDMMISMMGMDFERGLKMLKPVIETGRNPSRLEFIGNASHVATPYVGVRTECAMSDLGTCMSRDFKSLMKWIQETGTKPSGNPFSITHRFDMVRRIVRYTVAFPVSKTPGSVPTDFVTGERSATRSFAIKHTGPYEYLGNAWAAGMIRSRSKGFVLNKKIDCFETYENNPEETPADDLVTIVHFPIK